MPNSGWLIGSRSLSSSNGLLELGYPRSPAISGAIAARLRRTEPLLIEVPDCTDTPLDSQPHVEQVSRPRFSRAASTR